MVVPFAFLVSGNRSDCLSFRLTPMAANSLKGFVEEFGGLWGRMLGKGAPPPGAARPDGRSAEIHETGND
jgi:hypothetical protein